MKAFDLTGRVAIVTGGNGGIGLGMARGLVGAGATVVVVGRDHEKSAEAVAELEATGGRAIALAADVTSKASVDTMSSLIEPILIGMMGIIVGFIVIALFLPILQMSSLV